MARDIKIDLIRLSQVFGANRGVTHWTVSRLAHGDGQFFKRLMNGGGLTVRVANRVLQWFADNWPDDLTWPEDIPRPKKTPTLKDAS